MECFDCSTIACSVLWHLSVQCTLCNCAVRHLFSEKRIVLQEIFIPAEQKLNLFFTLMTYINYSDIQQLLTSCNTTQHCCKHLCKCFCMKYIIIILTLIYYNYIISNGYYGSFIIYYPYVLHCAYSRTSQPIRAT